MKSKLLILTAITLAVPSVGFALGFRIADQDAEATARGNAFTATADNPSAIFYNPAGITQLEGTNARFGLYGIYLQSKYTDPSGQNSVRTRDQPAALPQFYVTHQIKDTPFTVGFGSYAPFGLGLEYPEDAPFRTAGLKGSIVYFTLNPVIAWKINSTLSVAAGLDINYADAALEQGILPTPFNSFKFRAHGVGVGYNLGLMWQPLPQHSFGLSYHSADRISLHGRTTTAIPGFTYLVQDAKSDFQFPDFLVLGYSYRPTPDWNFEVDVDWTNWHQLRTFHINQQVSGNIAVPFNWNSSLFYEFGVTRYFAQNYHASLGYIYSTQSVPAESFSPLVPDSNRHIASAGLGWKKDRYSWDFAYQLTYGPPRTISNGSVADGDYRFLSHAITFSIGYHF